MPNGGTLRLRAENKVLDAATAQVLHEATPGNYLVLEVADTGTGISPEILGRIWDPFFTTKEEGKGTGLGLATVRGIAANHGGFVTVDSELGRGTTFRVYLPATEADVVSGLKSVSAHPFLIRGQGELILVVDDEPSICELITTILGRSGYRVLTAANGQEALVLYASRSAEIALVVTDLSMPEMGGAELANALQNQNPKVSLLFMSGAEDPTPSGAKPLKKPFTGDELLVGIKEALNRQESMRPA